MLKKLGKPALLLCAAVGICFLTASAQASAETPLLPNCSNVAFGGAIQPVDWSSGCLGGSVNLGSLTWGGWGGPTETATGVVHFNTCDPDCAGGSIYDYPAQLQISNVRKCASAIGPALYYTTFATVVTFPEGNAAGRPPGPDSSFGFTAECPTADFIVSVNRRHAKFGAFEEDPEGSPPLDIYYGSPVSRKRHGSICTERWPAYGMTVQLASYDRSNPCDTGIFNEARLSDSRWHTASGVYPGGPASAARHASLRRCTRHKPGCDFLKGYALSLHRSECALGRYPGVIAEVRGRKVKRIVVHTYSCE